MERQNKYNGSLKCVCGKSYGYMANKNYDGEIILIKACPSCDVNWKKNCAVDLEVFPQVKRVLLKNSIPIVDRIYESTNSLWKVIPKMKIGKGKKLKVPKEIYDSYNKCTKRGV